MKELKLSVSQAAWLIERSEKTIRNKIRSGELTAIPTGPRAEGSPTGPSFWVIDVEDLKKMAGVTLNPGRLAMLAQQQREPLPADSVQERLEALESVFEEMEHEIVRLRQRVQSLEEALLTGTKGAYQVPVRK